MNFDLKRVDVPDLLSRFHVRNMSITREECIFSCPGPDHRGGDRTPSAAMNMHTTAWNCMSCGLKGNAVNFLVYFDNVNPIEALTSLKLWYGTEFRPPKGSMREEIDAIFNKDAVIKPTHPSPEYLDRTTVRWREVQSQLFMPNGVIVPHELAYMLNRGFTAKTLTEYGIGWDLLTGRITIPWRDNHGKLIGFKARAPEPDAKPRYLVLGDALGEAGKFGFTRMVINDHVWGLDAVDRGDHVILTEGELDAIMLRQQGWSTACSLAGSKIHPRQLELLSSRAGSVTLWFDSDSAGIAGMYDAATRLTRLVQTRVVMPHPSDPASSNQAQNQELFETAIGAVQALSKTVEVNPFTTYEEDSDEWI